LGFGTGNASDGIRTLAESWNGTRWTIVPTPNVSGGASSYLNALSVVEGHTRIAVGDSVEGVVTKEMMLAMAPRPHPNRSLH